MERDRSTVSSSISNRNFNSHAHVERDLEYSDSRGQTGNFNSHAHVERDLCDKVVDSSCFISTHTLTWSVTVDS